jgi:phage tail sheath protein FI
MAIQIAGYPGVYVEEFTPGAPIEGVGTNTAAFIGTATRGPIEQPTLIQSWDAFDSTFGGFIAEQPTSYLAPGVYGFFLNGGTTCYIVRAGTGQMATADLDSRQSGASPDPALVAQALEEGPSGNSLSVQVVDSSRLAFMLSKLSVPNVALAVWRAETTSTAFASDRITLTVVDSTGFAPGDRILLTEASNTATAIVKSRPDTTTLVLNAPVPGDAFANATVRIADLAQGQRTFRLAVPNGLSLNQALPRGAAVSITLGGTSAISTIESSGGDTITLTEGLLSSFSMANAAALPMVASLEFDLIITDTGSGASEKFEQLAMHPNHPGYWGTTVVSELITLTEPAAPPAPMPKDSRPKVGSYPLMNGAADDRAAAWAQINTNPNHYLDLLKPYDEIALVCIPGATEANVQQAIRDHCQAMHDRFAILDSIRGAMPGNGIRDQLADVRSEKGFVALYYPWIVARNPLTGKNELLPPSGHIAGVYARTDAKRGVHKAPANANIAGALGVERRLTDDEQAPLNLLGINVLRVFPGQSQPMVWGARTTATDRNWQYINIRRLFLFLEESIEEGIHWAIFEPNDLKLWQKLKRTITEFLTRVWRDGALFGATAEAAFYVRIDEALNPPSTRALGRLYIEIGVTPTYPAEFIILRIGIWQGGSVVSEG